MATIEEPRDEARDEAARDDEATDQLDVPWTRVAAYAACLDDAGNILLARLRAGFPGAGRWTLPGGGLDWGEGPEDGVRREVEEETGLRGGELGPVLGIYSRAYRRSPARPSHSVHTLGIIYRLTGLEGTLCDEVDGSTDTCAWFSVADARRLPLVPLVEYALDRLGA
jgi:ADP-ribose pyrophosphatase YjhB (NUDIX family)